jgi:hypothetical protein
MTIVFGKWHMINFYPYPEDVYINKLVQLQVLDMYIITLKRNHNEIIFKLGQSTRMVKPPL